MKITTPRLERAETLLRDTSRHLHSADKYHHGSWEGCPYGVCATVRTFLKESNA